MFLHGLIVLDVVEQRLYFIILLLIVLLQDPYVLRQLAGYRLQMLILSPQMLILLHQTHYVLL